MANNLGAEGNHGSHAPETHLPQVGPSFVRAQKPVSFFGAFRHQRLHRTPVGVIAVLQTSWFILAVVPLVPAIAAFLPVVVLAARDPCNPCRLWSEVLGKWV